MKAFVISLDFELLWGVVDSRGEEYHQQLLNVHKVVPALLKLFNKHDVACTWATVGALCLNSSEQFDSIKPSSLPNYTKQSYSPYSLQSELFELDNKLLFARKLVEQIIKSPDQELASHTFCHYYCLEEGQTIHEFKDDLKTSSKIAQELDVSFKSLVFPRNQFNSNYLNACFDAGLTSYRGNPKHRAYNATRSDNNSIIRRAYRLLDAYFPLSGSLRQIPVIDEASGMVNVPASLFLRPWSERFKLFEPIRLWRIKWSMTRAAKHGGIFHLWWHPHNFGANIEKNLSFLEDVLKHYKYLNNRYGMESLTMKSVSQRITSK